jgi:hypothetical protein
MVLDTTSIISEAPGTVTERHVLIIAKHFSHQFRFMQICIQLFLPRSFHLLVFLIKFFLTLGLRACGLRSFVLRVTRYTAVFCLHKELKSSVNRLQLPKSCCEIVNRVQGVSVPVVRQLKAHNHRHKSAGSPPVLYPKLFRGIPHNMNKCLKETGLDSLILLSFGLRG